MLVLSVLHAFEVFFKSYFLVCNFEGYSYGLFLNQSCILSANNLPKSIGEEDSVQLNPIENPTALYTLYYQHIGIEYE